MLAARPMTLREANAFVQAHHRHSAPTQGCRFAVGAEVSGQLVGVAIAGRPVARLLDDGRTLEITRVCTTGERNACSYLYSTVARIARLMGYWSIITYTLASEEGSSLKAVGARAVGVVRGQQANRSGRPRKLRAETPDRVRWEL